MIKNELQYKVTMSTIFGLEDSIRKLDKLKSKGKVKPEIAIVHERSTQSFIDRLREQAHEYDEIKSGKFSLSVLDFLDGISDNLIKARIYRGWTHKELAKRVGTTEQQIQKYEASNYQTASLGKIVQIAEILKQESV